MYNETWGLANSTVMGIASLTINLFWINIMNARQFLNSVVSAALERSPKVRNTFYLLPKFLFPEFLKAVKFQEIKNPFTLAISIYFVVFCLVFIVQAAFAGSNGLLFLKETDIYACLSRDETCLKYFFGDLANLLNYVVLVEAYCISGCFFLIYSSNMDKLMSQNSLADQLNFSEPAPSFAGGTFAVLFVLFFVLLGSVGYAIEVQDYPPHWYINFDPEGMEPKLSYPYQAHYYYLFVNFLLLLFVAFVGVAHFGLFKTTSAISKGLRKAHDSENRDLIKAWLDDEKIKQWFAPFATQVLISKIFVLSIILNMSSWKMWEKSAGIMNDIAVLIMVVVGIWIVTLPRYFIQFHLFRIRKKYGVDEYKDIRMSWLLGGSAAVDLLLLGIAGNILFNTESIFELLGKIFIT